MKCTNCDCTEGTYTEFQDYYLDEDYNDIPYTGTYWTCNNCAEHVREYEDCFEYED